MKRNDYKTLNDLNSTEYIAGPLGGTDLIGKRKNYIKIKARNSLDLSPEQRDIFI